MGEVRGLGLMAAVELVADKATRAEFPADDKIGAKVHAATQQGAELLHLVIRGDIYNFAPCYATREDQIDRMADILGDLRSKLSWGRTRPGETRPFLRQMNNLAPRTALNSWEVSLPAALPMW